MIQIRLFLLLLLAAGASYSPLAHARQTCSAELSHATPNMDFEDAGPGMVLHKATGLIWKRCVEGMTWNGSRCADTPAMFTWSGGFKRVAAVSQATPYARRLEAIQPNLGGLGWWFGVATAPLKVPSQFMESLGASDWRLPNINELLSIQEPKCHSPAVNTDQFPDSHTGFWSDLFAPNQAHMRLFWSASVVANAKDSAWAVDFTGGDDFPVHSGGMAMVRLVRGGSGFQNFHAKASPTPSFRQLDGPAPPVTEPAPIQDSVVQSEATLVPEPQLGILSEGPLSEPIPEPLSGTVSLLPPEPLLANQIVLDLTADHQTPSAAPIEAAAGLHSEPTRQSLQSVEIASVPSLGEWGVMMLSLLALLAGARRLRNR